MDLSNTGGPYAIIHISSCVFVHILRVVRVVRIVYVVKLEWSPPPALGNRVESLGDLQSEDSISEVFTLSATAKPNV